MSTAGTFSPVSLVDSQPLIELDIDSELQAEIINAEIKILIQPMDKFRFRYKSEMLGTHGSLLGDKDLSSGKKGFPTVQLVNCLHSKPFIRCSLVTTEEERYPHPHQLVRKSSDNEDHEDPHDIEVSEITNYTAKFDNMGIIHTAKKNVKTELIRKRTRIILEEKKRNSSNAKLTANETAHLNIIAGDAAKWINLNSVSLCFQGFIKGDNGVPLPITQPVYSRSINNLKSALTGELKICRISRQYGAVEGNDEVWLLTEKVGKKNIRVIFYELDENDTEVWVANGKFSELDVHHQYCIVLKTPAYKDQNITSTKQVFIKLERMNDCEVSNSMKFIYKPSKIAKKRPLTNTVLPFNLESGPSSINVSLMLDNHSLSKMPNIDVKSPEIQTELGAHYDDIPEEMLDLATDPETLQKYVDSMNFEDIEMDGVESRNVRSTDFAMTSLQKILKILKECSGNANTREVTNKIRKVMREPAEFGDTPLHFAIRHKQHDAIKYLLKIIGTEQAYKDIVNLSNSTNHTPLHLAVMHDEPLLVRTLLEFGADPGKCDDEDATCLYTAVESNSERCVAELVKIENKKSLDLDALTEAGYCAIHKAAQNGSIYCIKALVDAGANINITDLSFGRSALHFAVNSNQVKAVEYLVSKTKIDLNIKNSGGRTALHIAESKEHEKFGAEMTKMLRNALHNKKTTSKVELVVQPLKKDSDAYQTVIIKKQPHGSRVKSTPRFNEPRDILKLDPKRTKIIRTPIIADVQGSHDNEDVIMKNIEKSDLVISKVISLKPEIIIDDGTSQLLTNFDRNIKISKSANETKKTILIDEKIDETMEEICLKQEIPEEIIEDDEDLNDDEEIQVLKKDEPFRLEHINKVAEALDESKAWETLANHTKHGSLVRLYRKKENPSYLLLKKIQLSQPNITVSKMQDYLREIGEHKIASMLDLWSF